MANWPFVQTLRRGGRVVGYRGWLMVAGVRRYLPLRPSAREASEEAIEVRKKARVGPFAALTLRDLAERFLEDVGRTRRPGTLDFYRQQLDGVFLALSRDTLVVTLGVADMRLLIQKHQDGRYSAQTIQHRRAVLRRMFRWARRCGLADADPTETVDWPRVDTHAFDVIPSADLRYALEALQDTPADYDLVLLALYTGLRRAELARIRVADIDLPSGVLWVDGKRRRESVPLAAETLPSIRAMMERTATPFLLPESRAYRGAKKGKRPPSADDLAQRRRVYTVANTFRRWARKLADRRFHAHALRHSLATELARSKASIETIRRAMRHRSYQTTQIYVHLVDDDLRQATGKLRLLPTNAGEVQHG